MRRTRTALRRCITPCGSAARRPWACCWRTARVNQVCKRSGSTALHRAVTTTGAPGTAGKQAETQQIIRLLLAAGADSGIRNKAGKRPIDYVKNAEVRRLLSAME